MPEWLFVGFELILSAVIILYILKPSLALAVWFVPTFALVMLANGIGHIVWGLVERKYVPGLITAPLFVVVFVPYYASLVRLGG